jgi:hypothetical protein
MLKKDMQMSQNHFILDVLGIKGPNIKVQTVEKKRIGPETVREITAKLTYPITCCRNCGFAKVVKNGYRKTHIRLASLDGVRYELILWKQRYYCKCWDCNISLLVSIHQYQLTDTQNHLILTEYHRTELLTLPLPFTVARQVFPQWQVPVDFIDGDVVVTNVVLPASLDQGESPLDISLNKRRWINQGVVVVTFGGVMNHGIGLTNQLVNQILVTNVTNN